jgi:4-amino-4-deoxy-L-arabinose transferase
LKYKLLLIIVVSTVILTFKLGSWGVLETSEARYAEISKEMLENRDYLHPTLLDIHHYHKPPVTYLITVAGYHLFGVNEFGARFFLQIAVLLQMLLIYRITYILYKKKDLALIATLIYFSLPLVLISSRNLTTDAYLNTFVLGSIWAWLSYKTTSKGTLFLYLFYLLLAIGFETKGPVVLIFPLLFIIFYKWILKDKLSKNMHHIIGIVLFVIVSALWYIILYAENNTILDYFLNKQLADRIASNSYNRSKPFWYYLLTIPLLALPWSIVLIHQFKSKFKAVIKNRTIDLVLLATILSGLVIFSLFKTKLILYVLPMFGFIAILSAKIISESTAKTLKLYNSILIGLMALFLVALLVINLFNTPYHFDFSIAVVLSLLLLISIFLIKKFTAFKFKTAFLSYCFGALLIIAGDYVLNINEDELNSAKHAIAYIEQNLDEIENIAMYNYLVVSTPYYSHKSVFTLNDGHNTVQRETQFEENTHYKKELIDIRTEFGKHEADSLIKNHTAILARKRDKLPDYLKNDFKNKIHKKAFGKWVIYY